MTWHLGMTSEKYEVGSGGPGTVSSGTGDYGGVSYGSYQLSSKMGTVAKFVSTMGYSQDFKGLTPGTKPFSDKWKEMAKDPAFGEAQHEFIKRTHYLPQLNFLKSKGVDLSKRGPAVQDAVWSTAVQFGGGTNLILRALAVFPKTLDDLAIVKAIQNYKIKNNDSLFKSSSAKVRESTLNRAKNELADLIKLCGTKVEIESEEEPAILKDVFDALQDIGEKN